MGSICGGGGGSTPNANTTTNQNSPPPQVLADYQGLVNRATSVANTPYTPYPGELTAPLSNQTVTGLSNLDKYAYSAQPYYDQAGAMNQTGAGMTQQAAAPVTMDQYSGDAMAKFMNPFTSSVINATQNEFNNQNAQQAQFLNSQNIGAGAFGGDRAGLSQSILANQQNLAQAPVIAGLNQSNYNQALAEFNNQQQTGLGTQEFNRQQLGQMGAQYGNLGTAYGNIGTGKQTAGISGAGAQISGGMIPQAEQQNIDTSLLNQYNQGQAYPFANTSFLGNIIEGTGSQSGGTGATTTPSPSMLSQILGAGTTAAGIGANLFGSAAGGTSAATGIGTFLAGLSDARAKENITPVGRTFDGQTIHKYNFKGDPRTQIGLLAQEVEHSHPGAVSRGLGGLKMVDYDAATRESERAGFDAGGALPTSSGNVSPGQTFNLGLNKPFSPQGALSLSGVPGAGAGTGVLGAGNLSMTPAGTLFKGGQQAVDIPGAGAPSPNTIPNFGAGPSPANPFQAGPYRQPSSPFNKGAPGPMFRPTPGQVMMARGGRAGFDIGGPTGLGNVIMDDIPNTTFVDWATPAAIAQGTGVPDPLSGIANIEFSNAPGTDIGDANNRTVVGSSSLKPSQPNLAGAPPGTVYKPLDYQDPVNDFQSAGAEASLGPHWFTKGLNGENVYGGQGTAPAGTAGAINQGPLLARPGGPLSTDTPKTETPPPVAPAPVAPAPVAPKPVPVTPAPLDRGTLNTDGVVWPWQMQGNTGRIWGGPGAGASGGSGTGGRWEGGRIARQGGGGLGELSYYTPTTGNARGATYHPPIPGPPLPPVRHPVIAPRPVARRAPPRVAPRALAPPMPPPRPMAPTQPAVMPMPDLTPVVSQPDQQYTAPRSVADPMAGTNAGMNPPEMGGGVYHSLLPQMGGPRGFVNPNSSSDPDPARGAALDNLRDQLNQRPGFNLGGANAGMMGQMPLAGAMGYTPQGQGVTGQDSQGAPMGAGSAKSEGFDGLFGSGFAMGGRAGFEDGGMPIGRMDEGANEHGWGPPPNVMGPAEMYSRQHQPWLYRPSYEEGQAQGPSLFPEGGARSPAPPPALAYPGDARNVAGQFHSSQRNAAPVLESKNMPPPGREIPMDPSQRFPASLHNYMNLAPSTALAGGGRAGFDDGGGIGGLGMMPTVQPIPFDILKGITPLKVSDKSTMPTPPGVKAADSSDPTKGLGDSLTKLSNGLGGISSGDANIDALSASDLASTISPSAGDIGMALDFGGFDRGGVVRPRFWDGGSGANASANNGNSTGGVDGYGNAVGTTMGYNNGYGVATGPNSMAVGNTSFGPSAASADNPGGLGFTISAANNGNSNGFGGNVGGQGGGGSGGPNAATLAMMANNAPGAGSGAGTTGIGTKGFDVNKAIQTMISYGLASNPFAIGSAHASDLGNNFGGTGALSDQTKDNLAKQLRGGFTAPPIGAEGVSTAGVTGDPNQALENLWSATHGGIGSDATHNATPNNQNQTPSPNDIIAIRDALQKRGFTVPGDEQNPNVPSEFATNQPMLGPTSSPALVANPGAPRGGGLGGSSFGGLGGPSPGPSFGGPAAPGPTTVASLSPSAQFGQSQGTGGAYNRADVVPSGEGRRWSGGRTGFDAGGGATTGSYGGEGEGDSGDTGYGSSVGFQSSPNRGGYGDITGYAAQGFATGPSGGGTGSGGSPGGHSGASGNSGGNASTAAAATNGPGGTGVGPGGTGGGGGTATGGSASGPGGSGSAVSGNPQGGFGTKGFDLNKAIATMISYGNPNAFFFGSPAHAADLSNNQGAAAFLSNQDKAALNAKLRSGFGGQGFGSPDTQALLTALRGGPNQFAGGFGGGFGGGSPTAQGGTNASPVSVADRGNSLTGKSGVQGFGDITGFNVRGVNSPFGFTAGGPGGGTPSPRGSAVGLGGVTAPGPTQVASLSPSAQYGQSQGTGSAWTRADPVPSGEGHRARGGRTSFGLGGIIRPNFLEGGPGPPQPPEPATPPPIAPPAPVEAPAAPAAAAPEAPFVKPTREQILEYNRTIAPKYGNDPNVVGKVLGGEMGATDPYQVGDSGSSFGPWQLHEGGINKANAAMASPGMGDEYKAATGHDPNDPHYWQEQSDFAQSKMKERGLQPWATTARKLGLPLGPGGGGGSALAFSGGDQDGQQQQIHAQAAMDDAARPPDKKLLPPGIGDSLIMTGAAMMAGKSPHAMVNIGEGIQAGMKYYQNQRQLDREWEKNEAQIQDWQSQAKYREALTDASVQNMTYERYKYINEGRYAGWVLNGMEGPAPEYLMPPITSGAGASSSSPAPVASTAAPAGGGASTAAPAASVPKAPIPTTAGPLVAQGPGKPPGAPPAAKAPVAPDATTKPPEAAPEAPAGTIGETGVPDYFQDPDYIKGAKMVVQGNALKGRPGMDVASGALISKGQQLIDAAKNRADVQKEPIIARQKAVAEAAGKDEGAISENMRSRSKIRQAVVRMQTLQQTFTPEHFAEQKASGVAMLSSIFGPDVVTDSGLAQAQNEQEFAKDANGLVMKMAQEVGGRILASEIATLKMGSAQASQQPGAAGAILAQTKGLLDWADARDNAFLDWRDKHPADNPAKFDREWGDPKKHPENLPQAYVDHARKNAPYKGDLQGQTPDTLEDGRAYMTTDKTTGQLVPKRWSAEKRGFVKYVPED